MANRKKKLTLTTVDAELAEILAAVANVPLKSSLVKCDIEVVRLWEHGRPKYEAKFVIRRKRRDKKRKKPSEQPPPQQ